MNTSVLADLNTADEQFDTTLRPQRLPEYVGQVGIKQSLSIAIEAAKMRFEPLDHILLYGPPGLGKTSLAHVISKEMNVSVRITSGPTITRTGDLAAILTSLEPGDILFIDEIHRLQRTIEETLYSAMEDFALDIILGKGPGARSVRLDLPKFTLLGATTRAGSLSHPLRDRFGHLYRLDFYSEEELATILARSSRLLEIEVEPDALLAIAARSRRTPRIANRLLKRVRDFAAVKGFTKITAEQAKQALDALAVDSSGLESIDRIILNLLAKQFEGGPVGLETLAAASGEEATTLEDVIEPYLLQIGFIDRTPRGRILLPAAYAYLSATL